MGLVNSLLSSTEKTFIKQTADSDCVVIFSKTDCGYCKWVKRIFKELEVPYTSIELNKLPDGDQILKVLGNMTGEQTVPRVFINSKCVGGTTEVNAFRKEGTLLEMISKCKHRQKAKPETSET